MQHRMTGSLTISLALLIGMVATALAAGPERARPDKACLAYDLHILTLIEDHGLVHEVAAEVLTDAAFRMFEAREVCREGDTERGVKIYDSIHLDPVRITPWYRVLLR
jgi:hypothetical protein